MGAAVGAELNRLTSLAADLASTAYNDSTSNSGYLVFNTDAVSGYCDDGTLVDFAGTTDDCAALTANFFAYGNTNWEF